MLTTTTIITLLTVGVLVSAAIWRIVEWFAQSFPRAEDGTKSVGESRFRRRAPLVLGVLVSFWGFPATWSVVVGPITIDPWWYALGWAAAGILAGMVAGIMSRAAHDVARKIVDKVTQ